MTTEKILNIITAILALAVCYVLIFEDEKDKLFWGALSMFFIVLAARTARRKKLQK